MSNKELFQKFIEWQSKELELFKAKYDVYGSGYWDDETTFNERYLGGLNRKDARLKNYIRTGKGLETESLQDCLIDIGIYAKMELIKQDLKK